MWARPLSQPPLRLSACGGDTGTSSTTPALFCLWAFACAVLSLQGSPLLSLHGQLVLIPQSFAHVSPPQKFLQQLCHVFLF